MKIEYTDRFQEHDCNYYRANNGLAVIRYWDDFSENRKKLLAEGFGQGSIFGYVEKATTMLKEAHGDKFELLLAIPVVVARLKP